MLIAGEDDEMFMTKSLNDTPTKDNRTALLTARGDKSVAYVTNNKRLYSTFCTDRHEASRGFFATAELLVNDLEQPLTQFSRSR